MVVTNDITQFCKKKFSHFLSDGTEVIRILRITNHKTTVFSDVWTLNVLFVYLYSAHDVTCAT